MDWKIFYRMLGVEERIKEPTYYHILGLTPEVCDKQVVERAFLAQQKALRQGIPGPELIAPILTFEKQVLKAAAITLADPALRHAYNRQLKQKQKEIVAKNQKKAQLIVEVRNAISNSVDVGGGVSGKARQRLTEKLRRMGVQAHNIDQIMKRVPQARPVSQDQVTRQENFFREAVELSLKDGRLEAEDEHILLRLAERLNIDAKAATRVIDTLLNTDVATVSDVGGGDDVLEEMLERTWMAGDIHAVDASLSLEQNEQAEDERMAIEGLLNFDEPYRLAQEELEDKAQTERLKTDAVKPEAAPDPVDGQSDSSAGDTYLIGMWRGFDKAGLYQVVLPVVSIAVLLLVIVLINVTEKHIMAGPRPKSPDTIPVEKPLENPPAEQKNVAVDTRLEAGEKENDTAKVISEHTQDNLTEKTQAVQQVAEFISDAEQLKAAFSTDGQADQVLGDIAMTMWAFLERSHRSTGKRFAGNHKLKSLISAEDRNQLIEDYARSDGINKSAEMLLKKMAARMLDRYCRMLESTSVSMRIQAIDKIADLGTDRAGEILFGFLKTCIAGTDNRAVLNCLFRGIARCGGYDAPYKLAELMARTERQTAFQIQAALIEMTGLSPIQSGLLPLKNSLEQRKQASLWWLGNLSSWQRSDNDRSRQGGDLMVDAALADTMQLTLILADLAGQTACCLNPQNWDYNEYLDRKLNFKWGFDPDVDYDRLRQSPSVMTGLLAEELENRVRRDSPGCAVQVDMAIMRRQAQLAVCQGDLEKAVVNISAAGQLLKVQAQALDENQRYCQLTETLDRRHQTRDVGGSKVLLQLRNECFFTLLYWDLLLQIQGDQS